MIPGALPVALFDSAALMSGAAFRLLESGNVRPVMQIDFCHNKVISNSCFTLINTIYRAITEAPTVMQ